MRGFRFDATVSNAHSKPLKSPDVSPEKPSLPIHTGWCIPSGDEAGTGRGKAWLSWPQKPA
ncbi:hypothetical protein CE91St64_39830 [Faecalicatena contorta]|nr:hypothetical protein CE91St64_39830 [Faecalicatena contorta]